MLSVATADPSGTDRWLVKHAPRPQAQTHLYCFPWSGAGSNAYHGWAAQMPDDVELISVALPGRGVRTDEPSLDRCEPLADAIAEVILRQTTTDSVFFGHSFGALLAHAVATRLRGTGRAPRVLIASGSRAPWVRPPIVLHQLSDDKLTEMLARLGGLASSKLSDSAFMERLLPVVRADLTACESYLSTDCPGGWRVRAWAATDDWYATPGLVRQWRRQARSDFRIRIRTGHHFSIREHADTLPTLLEDSRKSEPLPIAA